ncbi:MAG: sugar ABC transporter ATP-binding protein [Acidobacteriota bacterium]|nr:sugar ABC transporter ATP-binding protein [Acidobacteriota bacterium]
MTSPAASAPVLSMNRVGKRFGATVALSGVDFELGPGQVHALLGENGAGKSTLMKILSGALRPDEGEMALAGRPYAPDGPLAGRRGGVSMIYQELTLAPHLTVEENVCLGREPNRSGFLVRAEARRRIRETLAFLGHPEIGLDEPIRRLSVGARQIVEITRSLLDQARILVMDEPTSSLSLEDTERLFQVIRKLKAEGVSIIYISHFLEEVQAVADVYTVLRDGQNAGSGAIAGTPLEEIIRLMVGKPVTELFPHVDHRPGEVLLAVNGLKGARMAEPVTLELRRGEILGLAGLIGAGRTETLRAIFGLDGIESGTVLIAGRPGASNPRSRIRQGLGLLSEDRQGEGLALSRSLADNITMSRLEPYRKFGLLDEKRRLAAAAEWMRTMAIKASGPRGPASSLSGGNQQKVILARLLHQQADVLLFDEPTRGIDVMSKAQIYEWIGRLAARGKGILFVSSYFPELLGVCDRIAVFYRGRIAAERPAGDWTDELLMAAATTGKA